MTDTPCRHYAKYKAVRAPRCHCKPCWSKYFFTNPGRYMAVLIGVQKDRNNAISVLGEKYVKHFERFREEYGEILEKQAQV